MRTALTVAAVLATTLLGGQANAVRDFPRWHQLEALQYSFEDFVRDAQRTYQRGTKEWATRETIFNERLASIKQHNADPTKTYKRGINHFADFSASEWKGYNKASVPQRGKDYGIPTHEYAPQVVASNNATNNLPFQVDYRYRTNPNILTEIKNQGSCGSCWAHSATEQIESYFALRFGQLPVLAQQQVTSCTKTEAGCGGGTFPAAFAAVQKFGGLNEEWTYPYTDFFAQTMSWQDTSACQNITAKFPVINPSGSNAFTFTWWPKANVSSWTVLPPNDATTLMEGLALNGPMATTVASTQWSDYESGVLQNDNNPLDWQSLDHDVQLVGYGTDFGLGVNYWVIRNSWGTNYGEDGFIRLLRPEVEPCGNATGTVICGTSGVLIHNGFPEVKPLAKQNGYYF